MTSVTWNAGRGLSKAWVNLSRIVLPVALTMFVLFNVFLVFATVWDGSRVPTMGDFDSYYHAALDWRSGESIYPTSVSMTTDYVYPPFFAQVVAPITLLPYEVAGRLWLLLNIGLMLGTVYAIGNELPRQRIALYWMLALFGPATFALWCGQATVILFSLLVGAWIALRHDKPVVAGLLLACAAWIKVYPAFIILYFVVRQDWRLLKGVVIAGVGLLLFQLVTAPHDLIHYFTVALPELTAVGQPPFDAQSGAILGFTNAWLDAPLTSPVRFVLSLFVIGVTFFYKQPGLSLDRRYAALVLMASMMGGTFLLPGWINLLLAFGVLWQSQKRTVIILFTLLAGFPFVFMGSAPPWALVFPAILACWVGLFTSWPRTAAS